mmetsp:Transcript_45028/g.130256  ORF Transcript_45028/g.130256 Transcript_45028/m.130256 type:complete len:451 (+) Transcript_45028:151-1503(+)
MIHYKRGGKWHFINIFLMRGSVFPASFAMAGPCALISFLLKLYSTFESDSVLLNPTAWSGFSSLVGFLVVFRTSEAYSRFWDGCTATHQMRAEWIDAASAMMSFCKYSSAPEKDIMKFQHLAVRLFSLLHAMAIGEIEEGEGNEGVMAFNLELIDPCGLDKQTWTTLRHCRHKATLVFTWLQTVIVENIKTGVLSIPPPILSRVFQEMANGMVALHEAQKIANIPFPFPYAQTCDLLLFIHWIVTPVVTSQWSATPWAAAIFGFVQVFILWSLNNIAVEIEHPFGDDENDLDASQMQLDMNMNLLLVLHPAATRAPTLSDMAHTRDLVSMGRRASQAMHMVQASSYNDVMAAGFTEDAFWASGSATCAEVAVRPSGEPREQGAPEQSDEGSAAGSAPSIACLIIDGQAAPLVHMDPSCSLPISQAQHGDVDPAPALGTPRSQWNAGLRAS